MKLTKESIKHNASWKGYRLPQYDIDAVRESITRPRPGCISVQATCSALFLRFWRSACSPQG